MDLLQQHIQKINFPEELPSGHIRRFENKLLNNLHGNKKATSSYLIYAIAASVMLVLSLSIFILSERNPENKMLLSEENSEIIETEHFLQNEISQRLAKIETLTTEPEQTLNFKNDLKEIDNSLVSLSEDLKQTPGDQRIVNAIINTYRLKIETLDNIMTIIQKYSGNA